MYPISIQMRTRIPSCYKYLLHSYVEFYGYNFMHGSHGQAVNCFIYLT